MKVAILSRAPRCYSTRRLKEAITERGHTARVLDPLKFSMYLEAGRPALYYRNKPLSTYDAVIPRIGASVTFFGNAVVRQFESMGVYCVNPSNAISVSRDKLRSLQVLSRHHLGLPQTTFVRDRKDVIPAIRRVGGAPVVIKLLEGTQGIGVILADNENVAAAVVETLQSARQNVLIQRFVAESRGKDIRAFVVGHEVVGAMRRTAQGSEFRSNVHRGGKAEAVDLDPDYVQTAVRAAHIMGLRMAGVDMLEGADGPQIMEVNSSPGLEGIEGATGLDVAGRIVDYIEEQVDFPDIDYRERLTLGKGYGVAEIPLGPSSPWVGQTLREADLRSKGINVLSIQRDSTVHPHPHGDALMASGDVLICFGKHLSMREYLPTRRKRPRKSRPKADAAE